ncbi:MAG: metallopeptidase [Desulfurococcales archaeon]|nr:metallopeptidase [Desulfurococcales archaeon]MCE4605076.1 metallopeptidase [Desulfurococcales archaeon]
MPGRIRYEEAPEVCAIVNILSSMEEFGHVDTSRVYCVRSWGSRSRAVARIYGLPGPWATVLGPGYVIEVISERFYRLSLEERVKTIIHELLHIPSTFSGGLRPHGRLVNGRVVGRIYRRALRLGLLDQIAEILGEGCG